MSDASHARMTTTGIEAVSQYLRTREVAHDVLEHPATMSAVEEARATATEPREVAKTVVLHDGAAVMLAVIPASERLDLHKLRALLGASRSLQLASEAEIAAEFPGLEVGAIPPIGPITPVAEVVDVRLLDASSVVCAGGDHTHSIVLDPRDLVGATEARVADVCQD